MHTLGSKKLIPTAVAAAAIGFGALLTVGAPAAHASEKSDCEGKGGTYTKTEIFDQGTGKTGTNHRCCVKDASTNTTSCTSTTVTHASRVPLDIAPGVITAVETGEPPRPIHRVPLDVSRTEASIQPAN